MNKRQRLDAELVRRKLVASTEEADALIEQHRVVVAGAIATNPGRMVTAGDSLHVEGPPAKYVSRGGLKLEAALDTFGIDVKDKRAIDVGASTGGFTDCLLQHGAMEVVALDVGHAQMHERMRADPRVLNREKSNVRGVDLEDLGGRQFDVLTADLSFISLRTVAPELAVLLPRPGAELIILIKPQFEATHAEVSKTKGIISDPEIWRRALVEVLSAMSDLGAATMGVMVSPIRGGEGNVEFLAWLRAGTSQPAGTDADDLVSTAIGSVEVAG